jgi:segregation and condensation protein A
MRPSELNLDTDTFAGPFDLLCSVLLRRELELADVRLAEVAVAYVQQAVVRGDIDPEPASEFLLLVAALMEIKTREILNADDQMEIPELQPGEAYEEMLERLIRYQAFRNAATWLGKRGSRPRYWRVASRPVIRRKRSYDGPVLDPVVLKRAMEVLLAQPDVDVRHLVGKHASVHDMTTRMLGILSERSTFKLEEAVEGLTRLDQAVAFVAALELCKNGRVSLAQDDLFGPITVEVVAASADLDLADQESEFDQPGVQETEFQIA